jgi:gliding motility-associated-like protein
VCSGATINLSATSNLSGVTYSWTGPNGFSSTSQNPVLQNVTIAASGTYSVTVNSNGCISPAATIAIVVNSAAALSAANNGSICAGTTLSLSATSTQGNLSYIWTGPNGFSSTLQNPTISNVVVGASGAYTVQASTPEGCSSSAVTTVSVRSAPVISSGTITDPVTCTPGTGKINLNGLLSNTSYTVSYQKNGANPTSLLLTSDISGVITILNLSGGIYTNITAMLSGCTSNSVGPFTLTETTAALPTPVAGANSPLCVGGTLRLTSSAASTPNSTYLWSGPNGFTSTQQNPIINNVTTAASGQYSVTIKSADCSSAKALVDVTIGIHPTVSLGPDITSSAGKQLTLTPSVQNGLITQYQWSPATNLSCSTCPQPIATVLNSISYVLKVTTEDGCSGSDTLSIKVACERENVFIPDAFSPDGDGINDILMIRAAGRPQVKYFRIFNRWGELVFEKINVAANDPGAGWNGKVRGVVGPPDVYVYTAEVMCDNGASFIYKGNVSILK